MAIEQKVAKIVWHDLEAAIERAAEDGWLLVEVVPLSYERQCVIKYLVVFHKLSVSEAVASRPQAEKMPPDTQSVENIRRARELSMKYGRDQFTTSGVGFHTASRPQAESEEDRKWKERGGTPVSTPADKSEGVKLTAEEEERIYGVTKQFIDSESEKKIAEFAGALYSNLSQAQEFHDANPDSGYTWDMEAGDLMKTLARIRKEILSGVASDTLTYVLNSFSAEQKGVPKKKDALDNDRGEF